MEKAYFVTGSEIEDLVCRGVEKALAKLDVFKMHPVNSDPAGTRDEIAKHLKISISKLDQMTKSGELKSFKLGGRQVRYKWDDINAYLQNKK